MERSNSQAFTSSISVRNLFLVARASLSTHLPPMGQMFEHSIHHSTEYCDISFRLVWQ